MNIFTFFHPFRTGSVALCLVAAIVGLLVLGTGTTSTVEAQTLDDLVKLEDPHIDARYRYEYRRDEGPNKNARASTLRTRVGVGVDLPVSSGLVEFSNTSKLGSDRYNSTANGKSNYAIVADPDETRINQAYLTVPVASVKARLGRQRIIHDDARFVGNVGFRQQEQTYDGLRLQASFEGAGDLDYSYVKRVNRIFQDLDDKDVDHHLFRFESGWTDLYNLGLFTYALDYNDKAPGSSTLTYGADWDQEFGNEALAVSYGLRAAVQQDHGDFSGSYESNYYDANVKFASGPGFVQLKHEVLGSDDGAKGFETRLATLHAHNGWADQFLGTPDDGLVESRVTGGLDCPMLDNVSYKAVYHDYESDEGNQEYGSELAGLIKYAPEGMPTVSLKYARFDADSSWASGTDTRKLWATTAYSF